MGTPKCLYRPYDVYLWRWQGAEFLLTDIYQTADNEYEVEVMASDGDSDPEAPVSWFSKKDLKELKHVPLKSLPLYMGWDYIGPLFSEKLKGGK